MKNSLATSSRPTVEAFLAQKAARGVSILLSTLRLPVCRPEIMQHGCKPTCFAKRRRSADLSFS